MCMISDGCRHFTHETVNQSRGTPAKKDRCDRCDRRGTQRCRGRDKPPHPGVPLPQKPDPTAAMSFGTGSTDTSLPELGNGVRGASCGSTTYNTQFHQEPTAPCKDSSFSDPRKCGGKKAQYESICERKDLFRASWLDKILEHDARLSPYNSPGDHHEQRAPLGQPLFCQPRPNVRLGHHPQHMHAERKR